MKLGISITSVVIAIVVYLILTHIPMIPGWLAIVAALVVLLGVVG